MRLHDLTGKNFKFKMHLGCFRNGPFRPLTHSVNGPKWTVPPLTHSVNDLNCRNEPFPPFTHSVIGSNGFN